MNSRSEYKSHPLWNEGMELAREAYSLAEELRKEHPEVSRRLRKAAVTVPARIAGALTSNETVRDEHVLAARSALAEVSRQAASQESGARRTPRPISSLLARVEKLDSAIRFEFAASRSGLFS